MIRIGLISLLAGVACISGSLNAQVSRIEMLPEKVTVFADRNLYISGEDILFQAMISTPVDTSCQSRVLYAELIAPDGTPYMNGKFRIISGSTSGALRIPKDLMSGNYFLKSYTRFDRNFGPGYFSYVPVKIVNPYSSKVLEGTQQPFGITGPGPASGNIAVGTDRSDYKTRDSVKIIFSVKAPGAGPDQLCISVIPEESFHPGEQETFEPRPPASSGVFFHEVQGISLTGSIVKKNTGEAEINRRVNLSIPSEKDFVAVETDSTGKFAFTLPFFKSSHDIFLSAQRSASAQSEILVDNDFDPENAELPSVIFNLDPGEEAAAIGFAQNIEIRNVFFPAEPTADSSRSLNVSGPFYGRPSYVLDISQYIELPALEDYFNELPLPAKIRKEKGKKYFRFNTSSADMTIHDPLVLIDWIAIDDPVKIMSVPSTKISRVEFVDVPYVKGDLTYGGIISVISRSGDFGGIDLPSSGIFLNYAFIQPKEKNPKSDSITGPHLPDVRNTLFWHANISCVAGESVHEAFMTGDSKGTYIVLVRGTDPEGNRMEGFCTFRVE